ncbi:MAG: M23 family metallopeptidase [Desulfomonile tiedjei]|uniref:M23 family metallopeptidase n=1 Tax=Desulfomonile tiedjei TaxID=2358 RepID=A0A9D6V1H4_9BACT|nr:M23 family metallopeptidase [Desulfomonile tiedjei]
MKLVRERGEGMRGCLRYIFAFLIPFLVSCSTVSNLEKKDPYRLEGDSTRAKDSSGSLKSRCTALGDLPAEVELCSLAPDKKPRGITARLKDVGCSVVNLLNGKKHPKIPDLVFPIETGALSSPFGYRHGVFHSGIDITACKGEPVRACADGTVAFTGTRKGYRSYGLVVLLDHGREAHSHYAHLSRALVQTGQKIKAGDVIGLVGSTGRSTSPHLHLEVKVGNQFYNPMAHFAPSELKGVEIAKSFSAPPMGPVSARRRLSSRP